MLETFVVVGILIVVVALVAVLVLAFGGAAPSQRPPTPDSAIERELARMGQASREAYQRARGEGGKR